MPATVTDIVKQFQQDWTRQLEPDAIRQACHDIAYQWRQRLLDPVVTIQLFCVQILHGNTACTHLRHLTQWAVTASAYCQARMKLPLSVFQRLLQAVSNRIQHEPLDEGRWFGHRTFWVDGSSFSMPDTPELHDHFGQPGGQQPGCGFPVAHLMALFHAGTGMVLQVLAAPLRTHDMSQVVALHPALQPDDVLVADRGFCSYVHIALLVQGGVHAVFRVHQKHLVDFTPARPHVSPAQGRRKGQQGKPRSRWLARLGSCDHLVEWRKPVACPDWMDEAQFAQLPDGLTVRELRYQVQRKGFRVQTITLVTTLVNAALYGVEVLAELYFARWGIETNLAHLKTTMGLDVLKCKTVDGVLKELIVFALIYNLVRLVMGQAARRQYVDIDRISFIDAARWLAAARDDEPLPTLVVNPPRPYRYEPRVRKRRPKQYPLMKIARQQLRTLLANNRDMD
jgi:Transposase DDE domain